MKPIDFHRDAEAELEAAMVYYEERRRGLGLDFQAEVQKYTDLIQADPLRWPYYKKTDLRKCLLKRFPYTIYYLDLPDRIWIAAVAHQKRRPGYWTDRTPE